MAPCSVSVKGLLLGQGLALLLAITSARPLLTLAGSSSYWRSQQQQQQQAGCTRRQTARAADGSHPSSGTTSAVLADRHAFSAPFAQSTVNYMLLILAFSDWTRPWRHEAWKYLALGCLDCWSNWAVLRAFALSSITSVTLLDSWNVPCVMLLTWAWLGTRCVLQPLEHVARLHATQRALSAGTARGSCLERRCASRGLWCWCCPTAGAARAAAHS